MRKRVFVSLLTAAVCLLAASPPASAQPGSDRSGVPRRADGRPDLEGVWDFRSTIPLERPVEAADPPAQQETVAAEEEADSAPTTRGVGAYNTFWSDGPGVTEDGRTSLIVDPPDGRLPPLAPGALRQVGSYVADLPSERPIRYRGWGVVPDGPEDRGLAERCLVGFNTGPPIMPGAYNQNIQVFQTADHVVIYNEMVHDSRIVALDGSPHLPDGIRQWMGNSRGHWDGDTLVIESTNFSDRTLSFNDSLTSGMGTGTTLHLTERLRRVDAHTLEYEFTVNDPSTFTRPFTGMIPMTKNDGLVFEFACHEGNYGLLNILRGVRQEELAAAEVVK